MTRKQFWLFLIAALTLSSASSGLAQLYRDSLPIPAHEIYQNMLHDTLEKDFKKLERTFLVAKPVVQAIDSKFGSDIESKMQTGLADNNQEQILKTLQRLISLDMKDLMAIGVAASMESQEKAKAKFKNAYLDYLLLSSYVQAKNSSSDQKIRNTFQEADTTAGSPADFRKRADDIEHEMMTALPDLKL